MDAPLDVTNVVLRTGRLVLRPWRDDDLDDLYAYASVDGVGQPAGWVPHRDRDESRQVLRGFMDEKDVFAIAYNGRVVGSLKAGPVKVSDWPELAGKTCKEFGYALAKDCWGRGLMTEAATAAVDWLFEEIHCDALTACYYPDNARSARVLEKQGFRYVRTAQHHTRFGYDADVALCLLTRAEWGARRKKN
ncbi:MAG: GNAT family N-acetyltransferase [Clostridia bacterium]|nr:GNAT family N-acetyltransferase [Clostridia bacterium]